MPDFQCFLTFFELTLCLTLCLRLLKDRIKNNLKSNLNNALYIYILLNTTSILLNITSKSFFINFYFIHLTSPFFLVLMLLKKNRITFVAIIIIAISMELFFSGLFKFTVISLYIFSTYKLTETSLQLAQKSSHNLRISPTYLVLSIEQITCLLIFLFDSIHFDWNQSVYIKYYCVLTTIIFPLTYIIIHAKYRRLFLT